MAQATGQGADEGRAGGRGKASASAAVATGPGPSAADVAMWLAAAADEATIAGALQGQLATAPVRHLLAAFAHPEAAARRGACHALRQRAAERGEGLGEAELLSLAVVARDEDASVRAAAVRAAAAAAVPAAAGQILLRGLCDRDATVQQASAAALVGGGAAALPTVLVGLGSVDEASLARAALALRFVPTAAAGLAATLVHGDERVRLRALQAIVALGDGALLYCRAEVRGRLRDPSREVAGAAREATARLLRIGGPQLHDAIAMPIDGFDGGALDAKGIERAAKAGADTLRALANDGRTGVRRNAWRALAAAGRLDHVSTLLATVALKDEDADVRALAAAALEQPAPTALAEVTAALIRARFDGAHAVQVAVTRAVDRNAEAMVGHMAPLLDARLDRLADAVVETLVQLGFAKAGKLLQQALLDVAPIPRELAARALAKLGPEAVTKAWKELLTLLGDPYDPARAAGTTALSTAPAKARADAALMARLQAMYQDDGSWIVRQAADRALRTIGRA